MKLKGYPAIEFKEFKGIAKVVCGEEDLKNITKNHVVVTDSTIPEYLPELLNTGAIITVASGLLSHSAILARETDIPTIIGVKEADEIIKDNDLLTLKGDGTIILSRDD